MTNFQNYILNAIDSEGYNRDTETTEKKLKFVFDCFSSEYIHANNVRQFHRDNAKVFGEWISGLPSTMNIAFYNYEILNLAYLFDLLPVDVTEEEEDEFLNGWFKLVASEFFVMYNELN